MSGSKVIMNATNGKIHIRTSDGSSFMTKADEVEMYEVDEDSSHGGIISQNARESLNQVGNNMQAKDGGEIINQSEGQLNQLSNTMIAKEGGKISNIVKKTALSVGIFALLGHIANILGITGFILGR